jgi:hypothetical protein
MIKNFTKIKVTALKIRQKFDLIYFNQVERKFKGATYIRPEIIDDELSFWIRKLCIDSSLLNFLEIGSSSGEGSTKSIVETLRTRVSQSGGPQVHLLEYDKGRRKNLEKYYGLYSFVNLHPFSSIALKEFPTWQVVEEFYNIRKSKMNRYPIHQVKHWYESDLKFLNNNKDLFRISGIDFIKSKFGIKYFDFVLLDGGEFSGVADLNHVIGAKVIILDDINTFKNNSNYYRLLEDENYSLLNERWDLRNGFAVFVRIEYLHHVYGS